MFFIVFSSITLALENPLNDPDGVLTYYLYWINFALTIVFVIEMILKILACGFIFNGKNSYLRNAWNILDFIIVTISVRLIT